MMERKLIQAAMDVQKSAIAPYSGFKVGAALLAKNGKIYRGCNMENSAFSPTLCAERAAFAAAVADGVHAFDAIAVVGDGSDYCYPCGVCRQVMAEFCEDDFKVIVIKINCCSAFTDS
jgi:cytidine deaminase